MGRIRQNSPCRPPPIYIGCPNDPFFWEMPNEAYLFPKSKFGSTFMKINFGEKDVVPVINLRFLPRNP